MLIFGCCLLAAECRWLADGCAPTCPFCKFRRNAAQARPGHFPNVRLFGLFENGRSSFPAAVMLDKRAIAMLPSIMTYRCNVAQGHPQCTLDVLVEPLAILCIILLTDNEFDDRFINESIND